MRFLPVVISMMSEETLQMEITLSHSLCESITESTVSAVQSDELYCWQS